MLRVRWREWTKTGSVGCGLRAKLGKVKVRTGAITNIHGLAQALLGVVSVEYNAVKNNTDAFEDNLDKRAYQGPRLEIMLAKANKF